MNLKSSRGNGAGPTGISTNLVRSVKRMSTGDT